MAQTRRAMTLGQGPISSQGESALGCRGMNRLLLSFAGLLLLAAQARAQVAVDLKALDQTPSAAPARPAAKPAPKTDAQTATPLGEKPAPGSAANADLPVPPIPPVAALPTGAPPPASIAPSPPEPPPAAHAQAGNLRLMFDAERTELTPAELTQLRDFVGAAVQTGAAGYNVLAYSAGPNDDVSIARRRSLSRALAVRPNDVAFFYYRWQQSIWGRSCKLQQAFGGH